MKLDIQKDFLKSVEYDNINFFSLNGLNVWAKVVKVYDGDTVTLVFFVNDKPFKFRCRLNGIDCAEKKSEDEAEVIHANRAIERLNEMIDNDLIYVKCKRFDKYGRVLVDLFDCDDSEFSFNDLLIGEGLAYHYKGNKRTPFREWALPRFYEGIDEPVSNNVIDNINDSEINC